MSPAHRENNSDPTAEAAEIQQRIRMPLSDLVEKFATLADSLKFDERQGLAEEALSASQAILESVEAWCQTSGVTPEFAPARILVVVSDRVEQRVVSGFLGLGGHDVHVVDDVRDAIELFCEEAFDIVIVASELGGLGAEALITSLRDSAPPGLPILLLGEEGVGELDADTALPRPLSLGVLASALAPWLVANKLR